MTLADDEIRKLADQYESDARDADELGITRSKNFNERNAYIACLALSRGEALATLTRERDALREALKKYVAVCSNDEGPTVAMVREAMDALRLASPAAPTAPAAEEER